MKKITKLAYIIILSVFWLCFAQLEIPQESTIYSNDQSQYIDDSNISNPIRDWAYNAIQSTDSKNEIWWVRWLNQKIEDHTTAKTKTLQIIKNFVNYALWLLSLVALIYVIYHGIIIITAAGDDVKYKEWMKGVKFATMALVWIWMSWIIISSIFWILNNVLISSWAGEPLPSDTATTTTNQ